MDIISHLQAFVESLCSCAFPKSAKHKRIKTKKKRKQTFSKYSNVLIRHTSCLTSTEEVGVNLLSPQAGLITSGRMASLLIQVSPAVIKTN